MIAAFTANPRWGQRQTAPNKDKVAALDGKRRELLSPQDRLIHLATIGTVADGMFAKEFARIDGGLTEVERQVPAVLDRAVVSSAVADGLNWREWTPARRRVFLQKLVERIEVHPHPHGHGQRT